TFLFACLLGFPMKRTTRMASLFALTAFLGWQMVGQSQDRKPITTRPLDQGANAFLGSLQEPQKSKALIPYDDDRRVQWHFIPMETRKGLPLMEMESTQREQARRFLADLVSEAGNEKATRIMLLENVLRKLEGPDSHSRRNPDKYYFTIFGTPNLTGTWGVSIEGHHLSLNFVVQDNRIVDSTPQFFATNPAELQAEYGEGFPKGMRLLKSEEELGFQLLKSLDATQRSKATLDAKAPADIRFAGTKQSELAAADGVPASQLNPAQRETLHRLLEVYTGAMREEVAADRWKLIDQAGFDQIHFAWAGADQPGIGHYYRIQGPTFLVEFINVQPDAAGNPANHVHCVWRDLQGDFHLPIQSP
ncbi:MAG: DUF3500 domain-containing protein, partial [Pirellulaceae bacterium]